MAIGRAAACMLAASSLFLLSPAFTRAQGSAPANSTDPAGQSQAVNMVPGRAALIKTLDARKLKPGDQVKIRLADTIHLKDGSELPHGTTLLGLVSTDQTQQGISKLALRFNKAQLKSGKVIPIKATIVGLFPPESENQYGYDVAAGDQQPNSWTSATLQVDQLGVISGVDLHSKIAGDNSGVFVTTKKDDVRLNSGSELLLAIGPSSRS
jgi:hypothetical protein